MQVTFVQDRIGLSVMKLAPETENERFMLEMFFKETKGPMGIYGCTADIHAGHSLGYSLRIRLVGDPELKSLIAEREHLARHRQEIHRLEMAVLKAKRQKRRR